MKRAEERKRKKIRKESQKVKKKKERINKKRREVKIESPNPENC